jgi:hypothetical protein
VDTPDRELERVEARVEKRREEFVSDGARGFLFPSFALK